MRGEYDHPDPRVAEELNRKYGGGDDGFSWEHKKMRRRFYVRLSAFFLILFFFVTILGRAFQVFTWPSLDFLSESAELIREPQIQELRKAVVTIEVRRRDGSKIIAGQRGGTGFNISEDGLIVTNRHVVEGAETIIVSFPEDGYFGAESVIYSEEADIAVIDIDGSNLPVLKLSLSGTPSPGDAVTIIGNPLGYPRVAFSGEIVRYTARGEVSVMEIKAPIHPGSSGSPVFDNVHNVVGIIYAVARKDNEEETIGLAVPVKELIKLTE